MRPQRLDRGQREERQERQLHPVPGGEVGLGLVAQLGDAGDVDLDHGGQLRRHLQRLDHALGDDGRSRDSFSVRPRAGSVAAVAVRGCRPSQLRAVEAGRLGGLCRRRVEHILLADPAADTGAGDRAEVDTVLGGEFADQRGDITRIGVGGGRVGGVRRGMGLVPVPEPELRRLRAAGLVGPQPGEPGLAREPLGGWRPQRPLHNGEFGADCRYFVFGDLDLEQGSRDGRWDLGVDLVRGDLEQGLIGGDGVAHLLEPPGDGAFGNALPEGRHAHRRAGGRRVRGTGRRCGLRRRWRRCRRGGLDGGRGCGGRRLWDRRGCRRGGRRRRLHHRDPLRPARKRSSAPNAVL